MNEQDLEEMRQGYAEVLVWAEIPLSEDDRSLEERGYTIDDFSVDAMAAMREDCARLHRQIERSGIEITDWNQCGMDLYFTRQHHGVGFRARSSVYGEKQATQLAALVEREFSETNVWIDENGHIQVA